MYLVPMEMPKHCNKCPFGHTAYNHSFGRDYIDMRDGEMNKTGTYGYICNIEFQDNHKYTKVMRANIGEDIEKPDWCGLKECGDAKEA
jgi:hypothetical protein